MTPLLTGLRVLDLTSVIYGPLIGQILGDLGADVVKVEPPEGDIARGVHPVGPAGIGAMYANNNRNKRSVRLDLKTAAGRAALARLVPWCEVLVHNMRPEAIARLGFDFAACSAMNPRVIYLAAVGFGRGGPEAGRPAFDDVIQAASGLAGLPLARGDAPGYVNGVMADKVAALTATYGVLAAVAARARGRDGPIEVEAAMFESVAAFVLNEHLAACSFGAPPEQVGYHRMFAPDRRPFRTADGWIGALPYTEAQWRRLLLHFGRADIADSGWFRDATERSRRVAELYAWLAEVMPRHATAEWLALLGRLDIPHARVNALPDLLTDPHLAAVGFFDPNGLEAAGQARAIRQPVLFPGLDARPDRPAPALGADTEAVLREAGCSPEEIAAVIGAP
ncbi:MAG: CoA transferase [Acetobacteraceae bacterium]|nr:CoA transferase [Acetobacteraceae bacterium]